MKKVAVITGAGRGIGAATAIRLASENYALVLVSRSVDQLQEKRREILASYPEAEILCIPADVAKEEQVSAVFTEVNEHFGRLDVLVNNAGSIVVKEAAELSLTEWRSMLDINLTGTFLCSRAALSLMKPSGVIINISSLAGIQGLEKFPGFSAYSAAKAGVIAFSECLSVEAGPRGIRVACLAPGAVETQMLKEALPDFKTSTQPRQIAEEIWALIEDSNCNGKLKVLTNV